MPRCSIFTMKKRTGVTLILVVHPKTCSVSAKLTSVFTFPFTRISPRLVCGCGGGKKSCSICISRFFVVVVHMVDTFSLFVLHQKQKSNCLHKTPPCLHFPNRIPCHHPTVAAPQRCGQPRFFLRWGVRRRRSCPKNRKFMAQVRSYQRMRRSPSHPALRPRALSPTQNKKRPTHRDEVGSRNSAAGQ